MPRTTNRRCLQRFFQMGDRSGNTNRTIGFTRYDLITSYRTYGIGWFDRAGRVLYVRNPPYYSPTTSRHVSLMNRVAREYGVAISDLALSPSRYVAQDETPITTEVRNRFQMSTTEEVTEHILRLAESLIEMMPNLAVLDSMIQIEEEAPFVLFDLS